MMGIGGLFCLNKCVCVARDLKLWAELLDQDVDDDDDGKQQKP